MLLFFKSNKLNSLFFSLVMLLFWFAYSLFSQSNKIDIYTGVTVISIILIGALYHLNLNQFKNIEKQKNVFLFLFCFYQLNTNLFNENLSILTSVFIFLILYKALKNSGTLTTHFGFISSFIIGFITIIDSKSIVYLLLIYTAYLIKIQLSIRYLLTIIVGFLSSIIIYYAILFIYQIELPNIIDLILPKLHNVHFSINTLYNNEITSYLYLILSIISIFIGFSTFKKNSIKERKNTTFILIFILINWIYLFLSKNSGEELHNFQQIIINKSLLIGFILINIKKKWYAEVFFLLIVIVEIINLLV